MKIEYFHTNFGEYAEIRRDSQNFIICPICGIAYDESDSWKPEYFVGGLDCCPGCNTQMGNEDIDEVPPDPSNPIMRRWAKLRIQWLEREGWPGWALERLEKNLELSKEQLIKDRDEFASE